MSRRRDPKKASPEDRRGLTNGNGIPRPDGLTNGLGRTNGTGRTNGLTNGLTNGVRGRTNGLTNGLAARTSGLTNGLVNGTGRTNGLTNGLTNGVRGRTNGLTNGTGRTNGTGVINGLINGTIRRGLRRNRYGVITQKDLRLGISIVVLFLLLLGPFYLLMSSPPPASPTRITVDGNLGDWGATAFLNDTVSSPDANINLRGYSVLEEPSGYTSFAIRVQGIALGDASRLDGFYVFIDKDNNPATGYTAREIGADYMIAVRGGNNAVSSSTLYGFRAAASTSDWSGWEPADSARAAVSATGLEVQLLPQTVDYDAVRGHSFLVAASDYDGNETMGSVHFGPARKALLIQQILTSDVVTTSNQPLANLRFTAFGGSVDVTQVPLSKTHGPGTLTDLTAFTVTTATPITRTASVSYTSADVGEYITAHVDPASVLTNGNVPVTVDGPDLVAYLSNILGQAPTDHRVEGYFGDWSTPALGQDGNSLPQDANVDIERYGANHTVTVSPSSSTAFVYADVAGRIFGGAGVVERIEKPTGGGGGGQGSPGPTVPRVGDDVFRTYIDVDTARTSDGTMVLGIRADYQIVITGVYGRIVSKRAYAWSGSAWTLSSRAVNVANDRTRMEASLDLTGVPTGTMAMAVEATDWRLLSDTSDVFSFLGIAGGGTRSSPPGLQEVTPPPISGTIVIDGACTDSAYGGAATITGAGLTGKVGTENPYVYICIDVTGDPDPDASDQGVIYFDRDHNGGTAPNTDDRRFTVLSGTSVLISHMGTGGGWTVCTNCSANEAAGAFPTDHEVYEFKIHYLDVWNTATPSDGQIAGFAVIATDGSGGSTYTWGSTTPPADPDPSSWGHILAPEFSDILVPVAVVGVIYFGARRRRRDADS